MTAPVIGVDIGGTKIKAYLTCGTTPRPIERPTPQVDGAAVVATVAELCAALIDQHGTRPAAIGVGTAGQIDPERGIVIGATDNIAGWMGTEIKAPLQDQFGVPVAVDNDVNAFAYGEMQLGAGRGYDSALCIAVGTGVGGALVIDSKLWHGTSYSAGEAGYLFAGQDAHGQPILLEERTGGRALERIYQQKANLTDPISLREISRRAQADDPLACHVIEAGAQLLGQALGPALAFLDPQVCIVGGGVPGIGALWWEPFTTAIETNPLRSARSAPVLQAALGTDAVMLGAAQLAHEALR